MNSCAFYLMATGKIPFPGRIEAKTRKQGDSVAVEITAERTSEKVQVWVARADNLDFRPVRWNPSRRMLTAATGTLPRP